MSSPPKPLYLQLDYIDAKISQTLSWMNGKPTHDNVYDECCSDFSCCVPECFVSDDTKRFEDGSKALEIFFERRNSD